MRATTPTLMMRLAPPGLLIVLALAALGGCASGSLPLAGNRETAQIGRELNRLRAATRPFHSLDSAVAAGYTRDVPHCLIHQHHGAMGFHHSNPRYVHANVEVRRPEILLYERVSDGQYRLNGVEFIVPYSAWPRDSVAPVVMAQLLRHEDNLKIWYLHVWAWRDNSDGLFADFHPDVTCPDTARRVFTPSSESAH